MRLPRMLTRLFGREQSLTAPMPVVHKEIHFLSEEQFQELSKRLPGSYLRNGESGEQFAYHLGIQHALNKLREGFVVDAVRNQE